MLRKQKLETFKTSIHQGYRSRIISNCWL